MNRRGFLKSILATGAAPFISTLSGVLMPGKSIELIDYTEVLPLFSGQIGRYDGIRIIPSDPSMVKYWSAVLYREAAKPRNRLFESMITRI